MFSVTSAGPDLDRVENSDGGKVDADLIQYHVGDGSANEQHPTRSRATNVCNRSDQISPNARHSD